MCYLAAMLIECRLALAIRCLVCACPIHIHVVKASDAAGFLPTAVALCNSAAVLGSLSCCVVAPAAVQADPADAAELERAVAALRFGTVAVNAWSVFGCGNFGIILALSRVFQLHAAPPTPCSMLS